MKIRTINEAYTELQNLDSSCSLTKYGLRQLVLNGGIPSFRRGNRYLIDFDQLLEHLNFSTYSISTVQQGVDIGEKCIDYIKPYKSRFTNY